MAEAELKPCPFCGGEPMLFFTEETGYWDVSCQACGAMPYLRKKDCEAAEAWNTRCDEGAENAPSSRGSGGRSAK